MESVSDNSPSGVQWVPATAGAQLTQGPGYRARSGYRASCREPASGSKLKMVEPDLEPFRVDL